MDLIDIGLKMPIIDCSMHQGGIAVVSASYYHCFPEGTKVKLSYPSPTGWTCEAQEDFINPVTNNLLRAGITQSIHEEDIVMILGDENITYMGR